MRRARDDGAAGGERGTDLLRQQINREVPWGEGRGRADGWRITRLSWPAGRTSVRPNRACVLGVPVEQLRGSQHLELRLGQRLALLLGHRPRRYVGALTHQRRGLVQDPAALLDVLARHSGQARSRRREGFVEVGLRRVGNFGDGLGVNRIDHGVASRPAPDFHTPSMKSLRSVSYPMPAQIGAGLSCSNGPATGCWQRSKQGMTKQELVERMQQGQAWVPASAKIDFAGGKAGGVAADGAWPGEGNDEDGGGETHYRWVGGIMHTDGRGSSTGMTAFTNGNERRGAHVQRDQPARSPSCARTDCQHGISAAPTDE